MAVSGIETILANQTPVKTDADKAGALGKDSFMKLLVTQLQHQDPMNPMENTEFTAQLAQFSQLEALDTMKTSMEQLSQLQSSINNIQSLSFIGKKVSAVGNAIEFSGSPVDLAFDLDGPASSVAVSVYDAKGSLVTTMDMGATAKGTASCRWDGRYANGNQAGGGRYTYRVEAKDMNGQAMQAKTYAQGTVSGVRYDKGVTYLIIGDKQVTISDVEKILG